MLRKDGVLTTLLASSSWVEHRKGLPIDPLHSPIRNQVLTSGQSLNVQAHSLKTARQNFKEQEPKIIVW